MDIPVCTVPERLHPASEHFLWLYLRGDMSEQHFQRLFSLPNSDYIPLAECLIALVRALGVGVGAMS
jgi:hypothetical protein